MRKLKRSIAHHNMEKAGIVQINKRPWGVSKTGIPVRLEANFQSTGVNTFNGGQAMKYIKNLLGILVIVGVCGWALGAGTGNVVTVLVSTVLVVSCSIGVCKAEETK